MAVPAGCRLLIFVCFQHGRKSSDKGDYGDSTLMTQDKSQTVRRIFADGIYDRVELMGVIRSLSEETISDLEELFGLRRISNSPVEYLGEHVLESLRNRAIGRIVERTESPITRDELRKIRKQRKGKNAKT